MMILRLYVQEGKRQFGPSLGTRLLTTDISGVVSRPPHPVYRCVSVPYYLIACWVHSSSTSHVAAEDSIGYVGSALAGAVDFPTTCTGRSGSLCGFRYVADLDFRDFVCSARTVCTRQSSCPLMSGQYRIRCRDAGTPAGRASELASGCHKTAMGIHHVESRNRGRWGFD